MRSAALIAVAACSAAAPAPTAPGRPPGPPAEASPAPWDRGTFVTFEGGELPGIEESFEIERTATGWRIRVTWQRPAPTGEPADGSVVMETDSTFAPVRGEMVSTLHLTTGDQTTRSTLAREPDGLIATRVIGADGAHTGAKATRPSDWYIGGTITTFLVAICQAEPRPLRPVVYPGKATRLGAPAPLAVSERRGDRAAARRVMIRVLEYEESHRRIVVACEDGKLVGERTSGIIIVRRGDRALAEALLSQ